MFHPEVFVAHPRRSSTPSLHTPGYKTPLPPKGKSPTHPVEFLRQRNSVSRTTYILMISHGHTRRLPHLLSHINHYVYRSTQSPKSTAQLASLTSFLQANKKKIFSTPPLQSPSQPSTAQGADLPPQQRQVMHTL